MNKQAFESYEASEVEGLLIEYFANSGTFKGLNNMSDEAMESIYSIAYTFYEKGIYEKSQQIFQFLTFYDHLNKKYFIGLGCCQLMSKHYEQAINTLSFAALLDSNDPSPLVYMGDCYLNLKNQEKAKVSYQTAIACNPKEQKSYKKIIANAQAKLDILEKGIKDNG